MISVNTLSYTDEDVKDGNRMRTRDDLKNDSASFDSGLETTESTSSAGEEHFYESVKPTRHSESSSVNSNNSGANVYDTLDFERPIQHLQGHYASSKTLKSLCSTEDYLCPSDSSLLKE